MRETQAVGQRAKWRSESSGIPGCIPYRLQLHSEDSSQNGGDSGQGHGRHQPCQVGSWATSVPCGAQLTAVCSGLLVVSDHRVLAVGLCRGPAVGLDSSPGRPDSGAGPAPIGCCSRIGHLVVLPLQ
jgi:hypothetical protein